MKNDHNITAASRIPRSRYNIDMIDVLELIREHYEEAIEHDPAVKREWVEGYIHELASQGNSNNQLVAVWDDIFAFSQFIDRFPDMGISDLMAWDFSTFIKWADTHIVFAGKFVLGFENAKRILSTLLSFYTYLAEQGEIDNYEDIKQAYSVICGGNELRLIEPPANA